MESLAPNQTCPAPFDTNLKNVILISFEIFKEALMRILIFAGTLLGAYSLIPVLSDINVPMSVEAGFLGFIACMALLCQMVMDDHQKSKTPPKTVRSIGDREIAYKSPIQLTAKRIRLKPIRAKREVVNRPEVAIDSPRENELTSKNVIPISRQRISNNLSFDIEEMDASNIASLRSGYSVQKVIGGTCWSPTDSEEMKLMIEKANLVLILSNNAAKATESLIKVRRECLIKEKDTYQLDIYQEDFESLISLLNKKTPDTVFISSHPSSKADRETLRKHKLLTYVLDAF